MKTLTRPLAVLSVVAFIASQAAAQLPDQPHTIPPTGDYGPYSVQDRSTALDANGVYRDDDFRSAAYDNFNLSNGYNLDGVCWTGIYADPLPDAPAETDFIVAIWGDDGDDQMEGGEGDDIYRFVNVVGSSSEKDTIATVNITIAAWTRR